MTQQPTRPDVAADDADPLAASAGPENGQITRPLILQTALTIIDRDGADSLSMRRLSEAVGRDPAVLYRHVPNKAAVLDGVAEIVLEQLAVNTGDPDWAGQLRTVAHDFRRLALAHPNAVALLLNQFMPVTLAFGLLTVAVAMAPTLIVALILLIPMGAASVSFIATGNSLLQLRSSGAMRGRVMGLWAIVFLGSTPIGGPLTGFLAAHLGARVTLAIGGAAAVVAAGGAALVLRRIRAEEAVEASAASASGSVGDECDGPETRCPGKPLPAGSLAPACGAGRAGEPLSVGAYRQPTQGPGR